jgi:hypothetical protein
MTTNPTLQKILKGMLHTEEKERNLEKNESYSENTQENKNGERITLG